MKVLTSINETARKYDVSIAVVTGYQESELKQQVELMYSEKRVDGFIVLYAGKQIVFAIIFSITRFLSFF